MTTLGDLHSKCKHIDVVSQRLNSRWHKKGYCRIMKRNIPSRNLEFPILKQKMSIYFSFVDGLKRFN